MYRIQYQPSRPRTIKTQDEYRKNILVKGNDTDGTKWELKDECMIFWVPR
jgi:hypothetical protein